MIKLSTITLYYHLVEIEFAHLVELSHLAELKYLVEFTHLVELKYLVQFTHLVELTYLFN